MMAWGNQIKLSGNENDTYFWTAPLQKGAWHDYIVHVKWSTSNTVGGVEVWYDGAHVLPFTSTATLFPNDTVYLKQGLYRSQSVTWNQTLYQCGMTVATTLADVLPPTPDAGVTVDAGGETPPVDAGSVVDAGGEPPPIDAGSIVDAGGEPPPIDAGSIVDAGGEPPPIDAGLTVDAGGSGGDVPAHSPLTPTSKNVTSVRHHLGCASATDVWPVTALFALAWAWRRRRVRSA